MKNILVLILVIFISACGFEPLYVERTNEHRWYFGGEFDISINSEMEKIKIESIAGRFGQELRNELLDTLTPKGVPNQTKYVLKVVLTDKVLERQALRRDITATRERIKYHVNYFMFEEGEELFASDSVVYVSYDIMANPYSTSMAQKKAETDAAKIVASDISLRIGAYFHSVLGKGKKVDL